MFNKFIYKVLVLHHVKIIGYHHMCMWKIGRKILLLDPFFLKNWSFCYHRNIAICGFSINEVYGKIVHIIAFYNRKTKLNLICVILCFNRSNLYTYWKLKSIKYHKVTGLFFYKHEKLPYIKVKMRGEWHFWKTVGGHFENGQKFKMVTIS